MGESFAGVNGEELHDTEAWVYEFSVSPKPEFHPPAMYELFELINPRISIEFTEEDFDQFRDELSESGLVLSNVTRTPYFEAEVVL